MDTRKLLTVIFLVLSSALCADLIEDLSYDRDYAYQDLLVNGELVWKGKGPDCESRYEALRPLLNSFDRPFTVLEIGANNGYFSIRIAEEYPATCVMVDGTNRLKQICELNANRGRFVYLQKYISARELEFMARREHFDVVICLHVLHHQNRTWRKFADALIKLGDYVVIETPPANDTLKQRFPVIPQIPPYLASLPTGKQIGSFLRQTSPVYDHMFLFTDPSPKGNTAALSKTTFNALNGTYSNVVLR